MQHSRRPLPQTKRHDPNPTPRQREDQFVLEACSPKPGERQVSMFRHAVADIREHAQELLIRERSLGRRERSLERREAELQAAREATVAESVLVAEAVAPLNGRVGALEDELFSAKVTTRYARRHILEGRYFKERARYLEWMEEHLGKVAEAARVEAGWACAQTQVACAVAEAMRAETEGAHAYIELQRQHGKEVGERRQRAAACLLVGRAVALAPLDRVALRCAALLQPRAHGARWWLPLWTCRGSAPNNSPCCSLSKNPKQLSRVMVSSHRTGVRKLRADITVRLLGGSFGCPGRCMHQRSASVCACSMLTPS
jgi:hypothetical protein